MVFTFLFRELSKPVEGSLTMAPKFMTTTPSSASSSKPIPQVSDIYAVIDGQTHVMSKNNPTKPAGLLGQCLDPTIPDEDEILDLRMKPKYHFLLIIATRKQSVFLEKRTCTRHLS